MHTQDIITKLSSLHSRLIFRRRLIRVCSVCSHEFLSKIKKHELLHPTPLKMKRDCGRSRVRSSGPLTFFRWDWSWNHYYGHSFPSADSSRAVVNYWRKDVHLVLVSLPRNSVVRLTDRLDMTIVVEWDVKPQMKQNKNLNGYRFMKWLRELSQNICAKLREMSRRKKGLRELTRNLAEFSPRKFAFENFCSRSEREKRAFSWADL